MALVCPKLSKVQRGRGLFREKRAFPLPTVHVVAL